jgi:cell division protein FtsQ
MTDESVRTRTRPATSARRAPTGRSSRNRRPSRRQVLLRRAVALVVLLGLVVLVLALLFTPILGVRSVTVTGVTTLTRAQVTDAAQVADGTPMLTLNTGAVAARVATLPRVATVDVARSWPGTVRITLTERNPVGVLTGSDGVHLVDRTGFDFATVARAPAGLPVIQLPSVQPSDPKTQAVVAVLAALPTQLRDQVTAIGAGTPGSVQLTLADGKTVRWGSADDSARKAAVLGALLTRPGKFYDVSAPDLPTVS